MNSESEMVRTTDLCEVVVKPESIDKGEFPEEMTKQFGRVAMESQYTTASESDSNNVVEKFTSEDARLLIEKGDAWFVGKHFAEFHFDSSLDYVKAADDIIEKKDGWAVVENIKDINKMINKCIIDRSIQAGAGWYVAKCIKDFPGLDPDDCTKIGMRILHMENVDFAIAEFHYNFPSIPIDYIEAVLKKHSKTKGEFYTEKYLRNPQTVDRVETADVDNSAK